MTNDELELRLKALDLRIRALTALRLADRAFIDALEKEIDNLRVRLDAKEKANENAV